MAKQMTRETLELVIADMKDPSFTINDICNKYHMNRNFFYSLRKELIKQGIVQEADVTRLNKRDDIHTLIGQLKEEGEEATQTGTSTEEPQTTSDEPQSVA